VRVLLSTYGSRGDVEPLVALAVRLRELGAEVRVCAPPDDDFTQRLADVDVPLVPVGPSARALTLSGPSPSSMPQRAAALMAGQAEVLPDVAEGCDVLVATGMVPAAAGALSVAEKVGIRSVSVTFQQLTLPSLRRRPLAYGGRPFPPEVTDTAVLWEMDAESNNVLFRQALNSTRKTLGLAPVDDVREYVVGARPWLATDPLLDPWFAMPGLDVVQTGSWILPDERPLPDDLAAFLDAGEAPVYVGFGSMPLNDSGDVAQAAIAAARAHGRRLVLGRGWADLAAADGADDCFVVGEVNHQVLFPRVAAAVHHGGQGTTMTAARAAVPQVVVPQLADQPYWAGRVADLGIGVAHDGPAPTAATLTAALDTALAEQMRTRAADVAATVRGDGTEVAAKLLREAVADGGPAGRVGGVGRMYRVG
jgi:vancomycin aglycone glucosyltransferase